MRKLSLAVLRRFAAPAGCPTLSAHFAVRVGNHSRSNLVPNCPNALDYCQDSGNVCTVQPTGWLIV